MNSRAEEYFIQARISLERAISAVKNIDSVQFLLVLGLFTMLACIGIVSDKLPARDAPPPDVRTAQVLHIFEALNLVQVKQASSISVNREESISTVRIALPDSSIVNHFSHALINGPELIPNFTNLRDSLLVFRGDEKTFEAGHHQIDFTLNVFNRIQKSGGKSELIWEATGKSPKTLSVAAITIIPEDLANPFSLKVEPYLRAGESDSKIHEKELAIIRLGTHLVVEYTGVIEPGNQLMLRLTWTKEKA